jgi:hypothetical protein
MMVPEWQVANVYICLLVAVAAGKLLSYLRKQDCRSPRAQVQREDPAGPSIESLFQLIYISWNLCRPCHLTTADRRRRGLKLFQPRAGQAAWRLIYALPICRTAQRPCGYIRSLKPVKIALPLRVCALSHDTWAGRTGSTSNFFGLASTSQEFNF